MSEKKESIVEINTELAREICNKLNMYYYLTSYAILTKIGNKNIILCYAGTDIIDAVNIREILIKKYPDQIFFISEEFTEFSH